jgi:Rrf2 family protein
LEQLAASLRKEGLIKGNRGAAGGYTLARKPEDIRVSDVVWALEDHGLVRCTGPKGECARAGHCTGKAVWTRLEEILDEAMDRLTLADVSGLSGDHASSDAAYAHAPA